VALAFRTGASPAVSRSVACSGSPLGAARQEAPRRSAVPAGQLDDLPCDVDQFAAIGWNANNPGRRFGLEYFSHDGAALDVRLELAAHFSVPESLAHRRVVSGEQYADEPHLTSHCALHQIGFQHRNRVGVDEAAVPALGVVAPQRRQVVFRELRAARIPGRRGKRLVQEVTLDEAMRDGRRTKLRGDLESEGRFARPGSAADQQRFKAVVVQHRVTLSALESTSVRR